ncbi:MAG: alpha/beta hydrolase [Anaerolineales bacterium]|nr:alpha/beta hydrolase [Anaerolineales bacterium]
MSSKLRLLHLFIMFGFLLTFACTPNSPTEIPTSIPASPTPTPASQQVTFTTPDGASLEGIVHGSGDVAVIFSVMGNCKRGWEDMADLVAQNGMTALTYQWRGCMDSGGVDEDEIQKFVDDLRGAITFMREQGAKKIILVGASLGGCASAKLTVESQADGLVVVASPAEISQWGFAIETRDMDSDIPKLFITAKEDDTVPVELTQELYNLAAEPREWQTYPGTAHGTDLFDTQHRGEFQQRILEFILTIKSAN